jgi:hypothetical protein
MLIFDNSVLTNDQFYVSPGHSVLLVLTLVRSQVKDQSDKEAQRVQRSLHHISTQNDLLHTEVKGLRQALLLTHKYKKKSKNLNVQQRKEYYSRAVL